MSTHLAYLAGFFDGEGCIGHYQGGGGRSHFRMFLANSNLAILEDFRDTLGGTIHVKSKSSPLTKRDMWTWNAQGEGAWDAYYKLEPYLREKRWKHEPR